MFRVVHLKNLQGSDVAVFTGCSETGHSAKDVMTMPGAYEECINSNGGTELSLMQIAGSPSRTAPLYALVVVDASAMTQDVTADTMRISALPLAAANQIIRKLPAAMQEAVGQAVTALKYYETVTAQTNVVLPDSVLSGLDSAVRASMQSASQVYLIRPTENQEIFQQSCDSEYGIVLPTVEQIHMSGKLPYNAMDIIRVLMPYRVPGTTLQYRPIYHTPYFRAYRIADAASQGFQWIDGYSKNDLLPIQPNERHMQRNLYTLYRMDVDSYVDEMVSSAFFNTELGSLLQRIPQTRALDTFEDKEKGLWKRIHDALASLTNAHPNCTVHFEFPEDKFKELWDAGWNSVDVVECVREHLTLDDGFLEMMIKGMDHPRRVVTTEGLPFNLNISDDQRSAFAALLVKEGYISYELRNFFLKLCHLAYCVNWGHNGATKAVPNLIIRTNIDAVSRSYTKYLAARATGKAPNPQDYMVMYRKSYSDPTNTDDDDDETEGSDEEVTFDFDHYLTDDSLAKFNDPGSADGLSMSQFYRSSEAMVVDAKSKIVERWTYVNAESGLDYFLNSAYIQTLDINIYIHAFLKLMRWGDRKPKMLVLQDHPEIRMSFDLGLGKEGTNTSIVDENDLIKYNNCEYTLVGVLNSVSNHSINPNFIVGFILQKDYGYAKKQYLASWDDLADMVCRVAAKESTYKVSELSLTVDINIGIDRCVSIESFSDKSFEIYASEKNINSVLGEHLRRIENPDKELDVHQMRSARDLSAICLLTQEGITNTRSYNQSINDATVKMPIDRKYDILHRYIETLKRFYRTYGDAIAAVDNTEKLRELLLAFADVAAGGGAAKVDQNTRAAGNAIRQLNFDMGGNKIDYDQSPLEGKFIIVFDNLGLAAEDCAWDVMSFSDPRVDRLSKKPEVRCILLLHRVNNSKWVLCRKDVPSVELECKLGSNGKKICNVSYKTLRPAIQQLLNGKPATYEGLPLKLHISAKLD